jgi:uncharacterized membrane protein YbhN (UPF0104 family)
LTRIIARLAVGFLVGVILLWLVLRDLRLEDVLASAARVELAWVGVGLSCFAVAIVLRAARWHQIVTWVVPVPLGKIVEALTVGYAMNYVVPARLGEIVRADYCKRRFGGSRSLVLGTIALERFIDGILVTGIMAVGLAMAPVPEEKRDVLTGAAMTASLVFGAGVAVLILLTGDWRPRWGPLERLVGRRIDDFRTSLRAIRSLALTGRIVMLSIPIWVFDIANLWAMVRATGIDLSTGQVLLLTGVVSLSTLLPSAPGFLGTMQFAFVFVLTAFGFGSAPALVAATANQIFCFGSIVLVGGAVFAVVLGTPRGRKPAMSPNRRDEIQSRAR